MGSNRTFMELKSKVGLAHVRDIHSSNRTFMELKSEWSFLADSLNGVLIVPLWN